MGSPFTERILDKVHIVVSGIVGHLFPEPFRSIELLGLGLELNFGHDQVLVFSREDVDFPEVTPVCHFVPDLFEGGPFTELQELECILIGQGLLELLSRQVFRDAFDGQIGVAVLDSNAD